MSLATTIHDGYGCLFDTPFSLISIQLQSSGLHSLLYYNNEEAQENSNPCFLYVDKNYPLSQILKQCYLTRRKALCCKITDLF